jgi:hypothetical protein
MMENNETTFKGVEALLRVKKAKPNRHIVSLIPLYKAPKMNENRAFALFTIYPIKMVCSKLPKCPCQVPLI